jgi:glyoxylase-like metal-dependent hydrolase (beta-lactamase superfamily II)
VTTPGFQENSYLLVCDETGEAVLVDPGDVPDDLAALVEREKARPVAIWNTHGHIDHVGAVAALQRRYGIPFKLHDADRDWVAALPFQARMFGLKPVEVPRIDGDLHDGEALAFGNVRGRVIGTPGHTPGGVCLYFEADRTLVTGDTLFVEGVGRTDLPGGDWDTLEKSIRERLFTLPDDTVFHPGHGPSGRIGDERRSNPFFGEAAGPGGHRY